MTGRQEKDHRYKVSPKGQENQRRYQSSPKGKENTQRQNAGPKGLARTSRYWHTKGCATRRAWRHKKALEKLNGTSPDKD